MADEKMAAEKMAAEKTAERSKLAVLAVGLQNDFWADGGAFATTAPDRAEALAVAAETLELARSAGTLVLHSPELRLPGGMSESAAQRALGELLGDPVDALVEGGWGAEFVSAGVPAAGEVVIPRRRDCAFTDTRLEAILRSQRVRRLLIVGAESYRAVLTTSLSARARDYLPTVLTSAVSGRDAAAHAAALTVMERDVRTVTEARAVEWEG
jgi:nicotinamidase-related amidase